MSLTPNSHRRHFLCSCTALAMLGLSGCGRKEGPNETTQPREITAQTSCSLDGMLLSDYPGPKGQIVYKGDSEVSWFCDSMELLSTLRKPEQVRPLLSAHVQDMAKADWDKPVGHWIDARTAFYVLGSKRHGSMGPTAASFAEEAAAKTFAQQWGGRVLRYTEISPDMVDLTGGALHDSRM